MEAKNIIAALVKAQGEINVPKKSGINQAFRNNGSQGSPYATIDDILNAVRIPLKNNEIVLTCSVERNEFGFYAVARLMHVSGEVIEGKFPMLLEKQTNQGIASARTYALRYAICNILALPSDEDDDGNSCSEKKTALNFKDPVKKPEGNFASEQVEAYLDKTQVTKLEMMLGKDYGLADRILKGWSEKYNAQVDTFYDIKAADFDKTLQRLSEIKAPDSNKTVQKSAFIKNPKPIQRQV